MPPTRPNARLTLHILKAAGSVCGAGPPSGSRIGGIRGDSLAATVGRLSSYALAAVLIIGVTAGCTSARTGSADSTPSPSAGSATKSAPGAAATAPSSSAHPSARGKTVSPAVPGDIHHTVASRALQTVATTTVGKLVQFDRGITVQVISLVKTTATGRIPGEISGPAVSVAVELSNSTKAAVAAGETSVTVQDANGAPFTPILTSTAPLAGSLKAGAHATGTYVFNLPEGSRVPLTVTVTFAPKAQVATFTGRPS